VNANISIDADYKFANAQGVSTFKIINTKGIRLNNGFKWNG